MREKDRGSGEKIKESSLFIPDGQGGERRMESATLGDPTKMGLKQAGRTRQSLVNRGERASQASEAVLQDKPLILIKLNCWGLTFIACPSMWAL